MQIVKRTFDSLSSAFVARPDTEGAVGQVLALSSASVPAWASEIGDPSTGERVLQELTPSLQVSATLPTASTYTATVDLDAARHYWTTATATAFTPTTGAVVWTETLLVRVSVNFAGTATHLNPPTVLHVFGGGGGLTLTPGVVGGHLTLAVSNTSGSTVKIQILAQLGSARTVV